LRDDGAVRLPSTARRSPGQHAVRTVAFATQASTEITGAAEKNGRDPHPAHGRLTVGTHTIAIEVHQFGNAAGDLSMDARLTLG
jgi:hypothetical protein